MSVIEEGDEQYVQMAHLAIIGSRAVNGVAELHSRILRQELFPDFEQMWPERFHNVTNGVTQRRWLLQCNPQLANLITARIGSDWVTDLPQLEQLEAFVDDEEFRHSWRQIKRDNKVALASYIATHNRLHVSADSLFDCQVKRIHEYKRQLLNLLHVLTLYRRLKAENGGPAPVRRTVILAGKAAPAYHTAKVVIKLAHCVADLVNSDADVSRHLRVVFLGNYDVGLAEQIFPAADLSEQISTAGMEASGTGNMKFALNGALTIGTMDGANIEMAEQIGADNMFIFGLDAEQVQQRKTNYDPGSLYDGHRQLREVIDMIASGQLCPARPDVFEPLVESLLHRGDPFMVLADYDAYLEAQQRVDVAFRDPDAWSRTSILNCARMGKFSADRSVAEYARNIWQVESIPNHQSQ
jgi:starch phosphorylase